MIKYYDLVKYVKKHHVDWNRDLFEVLRGFFEEYADSQPTATVMASPTPQREPQREPAVYQHITDFKHPDDGEYTSDDLLNLFST